jgi:uncharacterized protein YbjT (DUF2867 family)
MKIAITGPTGNIGSKIVERLLGAKGHTLVLLARNPAKLQRAKARGAVIQQGDLLNAEFVQKATAGADALFWLNPPKPDAPDVRAYYRGLGEIASGVVRVNKIRHTVLLSSIGAHLGKGVGPVNGLYDAEQSLRRSGGGLTILRPGFFFENYLAQAGSIAQQGAVYLPVRGSARVPMIATSDIAEAAERVLTQPAPEAPRILPLHGPKDYSFDEAAEALSRGLGRPVRHVQAGPDQARQAMSAMGLGEDFIEQLLEMYDAMDKGLMRDEHPRSPETTTPTTLEQFAREALSRALPAEAAKR